MAGQLVAGRHRSSGHKSDRDSREWCHSEDGAYTAVTIGKTRVRIYDADGRLTEEDKVSLPGGITVLAVRERFVGKGKKRRRAPVLGLGDAMGNIVIWQCGDGDGTGTLYKWDNDGRHEAVRAMTLGRDGERLWFCVEGSMIICVRKATEGKRLVVDRRISVSAYHSVDIGVLKVNEERGLLWAAGQGISVHDVRNGQVIRQFAGHANPVVDLVLIKDSKALSACSTDQYISLWECDRDQDERPTQGDVGMENVGVATHTFLAPTAGIRGLAADTREELGITFAAVGAKGVAVWRNWVSKSSSTVTQASSIIASRDTGINHCCWSRQGVITVVRGSVMKPNFDKVELGKTDEDIITLPEIDSKGLLASTSIKMEEMKERERKRLKPGDGNVFGISDKLDDSRKLVAEMKAVSESEDDEEGTESEGEITIQEKLAQLGMGVKEKSTGESGGAAATRQRGAQTLESVFTQAVDTQDRALFDQILYSSHTRAVIQQTVQRMQPSLASGKFFSALVERFAQSPDHTRKITAWIREVLITHAGSIMSQTNNKSLRFLKETIARRVESLEGLTRLEGRLELVLAQADRIKQTRVSVGKSPIVEYTEQTGEIDGEENKALGSSDDRDSDVNDESSEAEE